MILYTLDAGSVIPDLIRDRHDENNSFYAFIFVQGRIITISGIKTPSNAQRRRTRLPRVYPSRLKATPSAVGLAPRRRPPPAFTRTITAMVST